MNSLLTKVHYLVTYTYSNSCHSSRIHQNVLYRSTASLTACTDENRHIRYFHTFDWDHAPLNINSQPVQTCIHTQNVYCTTLNTLETRLFSCPPLLQDQDEGNMQWLHCSESSTGKWHIASILVRLTDHGYNCAARETTGRSRADTWEHNESH